MVFQVTQCPHCESTFNINPRILEMASGMVRCGACLEVFPANDHLLHASEENEESGEQESVFIGGQPADFFDPSLFLTRSALTEEAPETAELPLPPAVISDEETVSPSMADETQQGPLAPSTAAGQTDDVFHPDEAHTDISEALPDEPLAAEANLIEEANTGQEHLEFFAAIDESLQQFDETDDISDLREIAALDPGDHLDERQDEVHFDPFAEGLPESDSEDEFTQFESPQPEDEQPPAPLSPASRPRPEEFSLSTSFALQFGAAQHTPRQSEEQAQQREHDSVEAPQVSAAEQAELAQLEQQVRQAIEAQDFAAALEAGLMELATPVDEIPPAVQETDPADAAATELFEIGELDPPEETQAQHHVEEVQDFLAAVAESEEILPEADLPAGQDIPESPESVEQDEEAATDSSTEAIRERALRQELEDEEALEQIPQENLAKLKQIAPPLQLLAGQHRSLGRSLSVLVLILVFGALLAGQYLWRYRDYYSLDPRFRSGYQLVCAQLACELPQYSAIEEIRSDNLAVRSHPEREDGLMVTVEIRNTAPFPQRFPILILGFNSADNQVIAMREFAPGEYLDAGLQQFEFMPVAAPVQVTLPIMDPGDDAINYTLAFRAP